MVRTVLWISAIISAGLSAETAQPELKNAHAAMRIGLAAGSEQTDGISTSLSYRFGLHDLLDRQTEHSSDTQLDLLGFRLEYLPRSNRFYIDEITVARLVRLPPLTSRWEELSWKLEAGARNIQSGLCNRCGAANLLGGLGATVQPSPSIPLILWVLLEAEFLVSTDFAGAFPIQPSVGPRAGIRLPLSDSFNGMLWGQYRLQFSGVDRHVFDALTEWRWAWAKNWALNGRFGYRDRGWYGDAGVYAYF